jgi:hypothetical protein
MIEIRIRGKNVNVPSAEIFQQTVMVTGGWLKTAKLHDEELVEGQILRNPAAFLDELKSRDLGADLFTFAQKPPDITPLYPYYFEWDNWAAIPIVSFNDWWDKRLPQESRKNVRRAAKRGVVVRSVPFDDDLVQGIHKIYNEVPIRQGRRFWHYGKDLEAVRHENGTYIDRSEFIGAYCDNELIGFLKFVYTGGAAILIQILTMNAHHDKRPMNALLAHAVQVCEERKVSFLVYGQYVYGTKQNSSLTEFKRRNGFEEIKFPRYYIPLSLKGKAALGAGLHLGIRNLMPAAVSNFLVKGRSELWRYLDRSRKKVPHEASES